MVVLLWQLQANLTSNYLMQFELQNLEHVDQGGNALASLPSNSYTKQCFNLIYRRGRKHSLEAERSHWNHKKPKKIRAGFILNNL